MSKILVLAEKPSVGREIARVLGCQKKTNGYIEGNKYIVTWALGHLVTLSDPESYDKKYASWKLEDLPMLPEKLKLVVIKNTRKQYETVKAQMYRKDVSQIVIATDAGREGELVARWILEKANVRKPLKRLWISSVTDKAIKDGFNQLKDGRQYYNLYQSAVARAEADWVVGINATRALTCKYNAQLSCGRVQTPTLAMVAAREKEIKEFKPKPYYGLQLLVGSSKFTWRDGKSQQARCFDQDKINNIEQKTSGSKAVVKELKKMKKKSFAPKLYDLTELQRDANKLFGFSAKETLSIMQKLYESHKVLTYPRTDSRYLTSDMVGTLKDRVKACCVGPYKQMAGPLLTKPIKSSKSFVDDKKVSDHHAIIPTEEKVSLMQLTGPEKKIYDLVVKRFLSVLYPPCEYEEMTMTLDLSGEKFVAKGKNILSQGWKGVYTSYEEDEQDEEINEDQQLPKVQQGAELKVDRVRLTEGKTKAPAYLNEATLLSAMENPLKYMSDADQKLKKVIGESGGIGTVATRADIIEKLFNNFLFEKRGKDLMITSKGRQLLELVPHDLKSPALTAKWEQRLTKISKGQEKKETFINEMRQYAKKTVIEIKNSKEKYKHENMTMEKCPDCGKKMLKVNGKKGAMLVCQDRECGHRKSLSYITNARCPECKKKLELVGDGDSKLYVCKCGFREKAKTYNDRRKKQKSSGNKKDVQKYLKTQNKKDEAPFNSAFGDALSKLKL